MPLFAIRFLALTLLGVYGLALGQSDSATMAKPASTANPSLPTKPAKKTPAPLVYRFEAPVSPAFACREAAEILAECARGHLQVTGLPQGLPGTPAKLYGLGLFEPIGWQSPYQVGQPGLPGQAGSGLSPYAMGGLRMPDSLRFEGPVFAPQALAETWSPKAPLDTPLTRLRWQRGAFAFNQFQVDLERALIGGSYIGLSYASVSADSQYFDYSFNVTQPYLSGWGFLGQLYGPIDRDSSSLVLDGVTPKIEANHFRPRLGFWLDTNEVVEVFYDRQRNRTNLGTPRGAGGRDSTFAPYATLGAGDVFGFLYGASLDGAPHLRHSLHYVHGTGERELNARDTAGVIFVNDPTLQSVTDHLTWQGAWRGAGMDVAVWARAESESIEGRLAALGSSAGSGVGTGASTRSAWRDQQALGLTLSSKHLLDIHAGLGMKRESRATNRVVYLPEAYAEADKSLPLGFGVALGAMARRTDPAPLLLLRDEPAMNFLASPELDSRTEWGGQGVLRWGRGIHGLYGGAEVFWLQDPWAPMVLPEIDSGTVADTLALRLRNYASQERLQALVGLRSGLGNWRLWLENRFLIHDRIDDPGYLDEAQDLHSVPARLFRGQLLWTRRLISERMRLRLEWNWEWMSRRVVWASNLNGTATAVKLDEYLMLDFYAGMQIKTFTLHFRAQNMNHDRYAPEPGVHPVGVNFRFGVDWSMFN